MTKEYFNDNWHKECLKGGVLTIPDNLTELSGWEFHGCEDIRKVILPSYGIDIADEVFCDCVNLEEVENFPPTYHVDEEFIDEDTGEKIILLRIAHTMFLLLFLRDASIYSKISNE